MAEQSFDETINSFLNQWGIWIVLGLIVIIVIVVLARRSDEVLKDFGSGFGGLVANAGSAIWNRLLKPILQWIWRQLWLVIIGFVIVLFGVGYFFYDGDVLGLLRGLGLLPSLDP